MEGEKMSRNLKNLLTGIVLLLAMTMLNIGVISVSAASIPSDAVEWKGHYYKAYNSGYGYNKAKSYCESLGGHLVTINSEAENSIVSDLADQAGRNCYWIGIHIDSQGIYKWITGEKSSYSNWGSEEPDNYLDNQGYGFIFGNSINSWRIGEWGDMSEDCNSWDGASAWGKENFGFICEWEAHAHSWNSGAVTKTATCGRSGVKTYTCTICGTTKKVTIAKKTTHTWSSWKTTSKATVFSAEKQKRTCSVCKKTETRNYGKKLKATMSVSTSSMKLKKNQKTTAFKVTKMSNGDYLKSVKSSDTKVLKVSKYTKAGAITLAAQKKTGTAKLTITLASGLKKTVVVKVQSGTVKTTKISGVLENITLKKGKKTTLKPIISPITSQQKVTYSTSNKKVASVSSKGVITAKKAGTAKITVKSGSKKVTVTVKVQ